MKIDISDIVKTDGASLSIDFTESVEGLEKVEDFYLKGPVSFSGRLVNASGILKLDGIMKATYSTQCYRCLKDVTEEMDIQVKEDFLNRENTEDTEVFTYTGNSLELDKVLKDNIILNLPMKKACSEDCKGLCPKCGKDLNIDCCECTEDEVNPRMEILKNFFQN